MTARIEIRGDTPAKLLQLLPRLGLEAVLRDGDVVSRPDRHTAAASFESSLALRVQFGTDRTIDTGSPTPPNIVIGGDTDAGDSLVDFATDSPMAAACFILSNALGLPSPILTGDERLFEVICSAIALAPGLAAVLVEGEIGVGKESLIKMIHAASGDPMGLLHAECAGLEARFVEGEIAPLLTRAGAATKMDLQARGGTVFFDRIGELSADAQVRLLSLIRRSVLTGRVHQSPIDRGELLSYRDSRAKVRLLAASTTPLAAMVARGEFLKELQELFDTTLTIPPLRDRIGDLPILVRHALRMRKSSLTLSAAALRHLSQYRFPGNLRELANFVTRIAIVPATPPIHYSGGGRGIGIVGRAEVIRQLAQPNLDSLWKLRARSTVGVG
jgi:Sigma-54 interaction domain